MLICPSPPAERSFSAWSRLVRVSQSPPTSLRTTETIGALDWNLCQAGPGSSCCSKDCIVMPSQFRVLTRGGKKFPDLYAYPSITPPVVLHCVHACGDAARTLTKRSGSTKTSLPSEHLPRYPMYPWRQVHLRMRASPRVGGIRITRSAFPWFESYQAASASL